MKENIFFNSMLLVKRDNIMWCRALPSFLKLRMMLAVGMAVRSLAKRLYSSIMYSGGSSRVLPGGRSGGPKPDRLKVRRNCSFRLSTRLCMSMLVPWSWNDGSTTPPWPSPSPGAGRYLWWELEMGLLSTQRGPRSSRVENSSNRVLKLQMVHSWAAQMHAMGETICSTVVYTRCG